MIIDNNLVKRRSATPESGNDEPWRWQPRRESSCDGHRQPRQESSHVTIHDGPQQIMASSKLASAPRRTDTKWPCRESDDAVVKKSNLVELAPRRQINLVTMHDNKAAYVDGSAEVHRLEGIDVAIFSDYESSAGHVKSPAARDGGQDTTWRAAAQIVCAWWFVFRKKASRDNPV